MTKEERVIEVDAATMEIFLSTYSADRITEPKGARLKGVVDFEGKLYTCVGSVSAGEEPPTECLMVEVIPRDKDCSDDQWEGDTVTYAEKVTATQTDEDREMFYLGIRVKHKGKDYVLGDAFKAILEGSRPVAEPKVEVRVKREKFSTMAKYTFTEKETLEMGATMGRAVENEAQLTDEKKAILSDYTAKINNCQANVRELARKLGAGYEFRMIEHERTYDYNEMVVYVTRLDTFECTEERAMTGQEAQMDMGFREEEEEYEVYAGGSTEEEREPEVEADHAEGAEAEEPLGEGQEVPEAESTLSTLGVSSAFPTEYEDEETTEGGEDIDRD